MTISIDHSDRRFSCGAIGRWKFAPGAAFTAVLVSLVAGGCAAPQVPTIVAAGDIAQCESRPAQHSAAMATAELVAARRSAAVLTLGDNAYDTGTAAQFRDCYAPTWGRFRERTFPSPGNHDYDTAGADGYYTYFGAAAGPDRRGYYSFELGSWHVVSLNSNVEAAKGSAQERWLREDLAANRAGRCLLAYWHHAMFSSSASHGNDPKMADIWRTLQEFDADVVLQGHNHNYERFAPQTAAGVADSANGIRAFVVGTGGARFQAFAAPKPNSEVRIANAHGVVAFALGDGFYEWEFIPANANGPRDSGRANCKR